jgi:hypothetical protein
MSKREKRKKKGDIQVQGIVRGTEERRAWRIQVRRGRGKKWIVNISAILETGLYARQECISMGDACQLLALVILCMIT